YLLSSAIDYVGFLDPTDNKQISLVIHVAQIASSEPAVSKNGLCSALIFVASCECGPSQRNLSVLPRRELTTFAVNDLDLGASRFPYRAWFASFQRVRSNLAGGFCHPIRFDYRSAKQRFEPFKHID